MKTTLTQKKSAFVSCLTIALIFLFSNYGKAHGLVGGSISYQCTTTPGILKVTIKAYSDCAGLSLCGGCSNPIPNGTTYGCNFQQVTTKIIGLSPEFLGVNYGTFTLTADQASSGFDIIQTCKSNTSICTNCNTRTGGTFTTGIEVYTFEGNANLTAIPATCCRVGLQANNIERYFKTNTVDINQDYFMIAELNRCQTICNSAPVFTNEAVVAVCSGVDFVYNLGATDVDGDSLSYSFGVPYRALNTEVIYTNPYSSSYLIPYFGAPNMNAASPAGMRIDPITGDIMFRPTSIVNTYLIIEVTQWKLIGGIRVDVGKTRRDVGFITLACNSNKIPILKTYIDGISQNGNQNFTAYDGQQICIDIVAQDQSLINNDPLTSDTTDLSWNNPIWFDNTMSNATFTRNYILANRAINGPKADSFKFCWTPPSSAIRSLPHIFTVSGSDRFCPIRSVFTRGINITVEAPKMLITKSTKKVFCNNKTTSFNLDYEANGINLLSNNLFIVQLSDSLGIFTNAKIIGSEFNTNNSGSISVNLPSGLALNKNYKLRLLSSSQTNLATAPYDILIIPGFNEPVITAKNNSICDGLKTNISLNSTDNISNYKWFFNNQPINNTNLNSSNLQVSLKGEYKLAVNNEGCADTSNTVEINVNENPKVGFTINNTSQCLNGNNFLFNDTSTISSGTLNRKWYFNENKDDTSTLLSPNKTYSKSNSYVIKLIVESNNNCKDSIIKIVAVYPNPVAEFSIQDSAQCLFGNSFQLTNNSKNINNQVWSFGDSSNTTTLSNPTKTYNKIGTYTIKLLVKNYNNCDDSIFKIVVVNAQPNIGNIFGNTSPSSITTSFTYSVLNQVNSTYNWTATNGTIQTGQGTNMVNVIWPTAGIGNLTAKIINNYGCMDSSILPIKITNVGVNELNHNFSQIHFKPNPFSTNLEINFTSVTKESTRLIITDAIGKEVYVQHFYTNIGDNNVITEDLSTLKPGFYMATLANINGQSKAFKVIKN